MVVHSINIFDKRGKILFTKAYSPVAIKQERYLLESGTAEPGSDPVTEQKKLIFGMLFSLRELVGNLTPEHSRKCKLSIVSQSCRSVCLFTCCCLAFFFLFRKKSQGLVLHALLYAVLLISFFVITSYCSSYNISHINTALQSIQTASATVHTYETLSGLRFALYTSNDVPTCKLSERTVRGAVDTMLTSSSATAAAAATSSALESKTSFGRDALVHIYSNIWVECVVRSPMYVGNSGDAMVECIKSTSFEKELDSYLSSLYWFQ